MLVNIYLSTRANYSISTRRSKLQRSKRKDSRSSNACHTEQTRGAPIKRHCLSHVALRSLISSSRHARTTLRRCSNSASSLCRPLSMAASSLLKSFVPLTCLWRNPRLIRAKLRLPCVPAAMLFAARRLLLKGSGGAGGNGALGLAGQAARPRHVDVLLVTARITHVALAPVAWGSGVEKAARSAQATE
eukprot:5974542-Pleurochrysis_carterae.AAC.2